MRRSNLSDAEYERRKRLSLTVTKELRYMHRHQGKYTPIRVLDYEIVKEYSTGDCALWVTLETGEQFKIHSAFFADMQKPSFEHDMEEAAAAL